MTWLAEVMPTVMKLLDMVPFKGFRNVVAWVAAAAVGVLSLYGKISPAASSALLAVLLPAAGYYSGVHE